MRSKVSIYHTATGAFQFTGSEDSTKAQKLLATGESTLTELIAPSTTAVFQDGAWVEPD